MQPSDTEQAFAETLLLLGELPGTFALYLLERKRIEPERPLWELAAELDLAPKKLLNQAYLAAVSAVEEAGALRLDLAQGAMVGAWELVEERGRELGGAVWSARQGDLTGFLRLVPPGSGQDPQRAARFRERSNPGLEPPHPTIMRVDEAEEDFGWLYAATREWDGVPLASLLENGPLAETSALSLAQSLGTSLAVIHDLGVVHGGINPLGVLVCEGRTFLSDFGVGSALLDGPAAGCRPGGRLSLLRFASPQLVRGSEARGLDGRDDLYALGSLLYGCVCRASTSDAPAEPGAPWPVEPPVSPPTRELLARLLATNPEERYPDAPALLDDLARLSQGQPLAELGAPSRVVQGRRAPGAAPQVALGVEGSSERRALAAGPEPEVDEFDIDEDEEAVARPASERLGKKSERLGKKSERLGKKSERLEKKSERLGKKSERTLGTAGPRSSSSQRLGRPKSAGWGWMVGSLVLVGVALAGGWVVGQARGADLARIQLARAIREAGASPAPWHVAVDLCERSLTLAGQDPALLLQGLVMREHLLRGARAERDLLRAAADAGGGDAVRAKQKDLLGRLGGTPLACLVDYDLAVGQPDGIVPLVWGQMGERLLEAGHPREAWDAFRRGGRQEQVEAALAAGMVQISGGITLLPGGEGTPWTIERRKPVYLGRTEVTRGEYRRFLAALKQSEHPHDRCLPGELTGKDHAPTDWGVESGPDDDLPATGLDFYDAWSYATWLGASLPDLATLQAAARGPRGQPYPWGRIPPEETLVRCGQTEGGPLPVGCCPGGAAPSGALDLLGNVAEWIRPEDPRPSEAGVFGGSYLTPPGELRPAALEQLPVSARRPYVGFRVMLAPAEGR